MSLINSPPIVSPLVNDQGSSVPSFSNWLTQVFRLLADSVNSGTTAQRPTTNLYVAKPYWDKTLGYKIHYNGTIWVKYDGTPA